MKHIQIFEDFNKGYDLVGHPNDKEIIHISQKEFDLINMVTYFIIQWKLKTPMMGTGPSSWTYRDEEKEDLKDWLYVYRETGDTDSLASDAKKYNL